MKRFIPTTWLPTLPGAASLALDGRIASHNSRTSNAAVTAALEDGAETGRPNWFGC